MHHSRMFLIAVCTILVLLVSACAPFSSVTIGRGDRPSVHSDRGRHNGPPPHAPAHGYRHKHRHQGENLELVFDSDRGVYIVVGVPDRYYWNGYYLRIDGDQWYASVNLDRGWELRSGDSLPPGTKKHKKHLRDYRIRLARLCPAKGHW